MVANPGAPLRNVRGVGILGTDRRAVEGNIFRDLLLKETAASDEAAAPLAAGTSEECATIASEPRIMLLRSSGSTTTPLRDLFAFLTADNPQIEADCLFQVGHRGGQDDRLVLAPRSVGQARLYDKDFGFDGYEPTEFDETIDVIE